MKVKVNNKDDIWSADLTFVPKDHIVPKDNGYNIILTIIDLYTRFSFAVPLKNKKGSSIKEAFENIFDKYQRIPGKL